MTNKDDTTVPLPPAAQGARALLSMAFGWVFLRGYQLRGDLLSPPPGEDEMMHFSSTDFMSTPNRQLRGITETQEQLFATKKEHSAACLLIQKDDFRLSEWLAYHTFMTPLDYLVVATTTTDPLNRPIPSDLLDMYQKEVGMMIVEWNDSNYYNNGEQHNSTEFLSRPQQFKQTCALHMQGVKRNWVTYHDSDEYIMNTRPLSSKNNDVASTHGSGETMPLAPEWMDQFVNHHGKEKANRLLGGVLKAVVV